MHVAFSSRCTLRRHSGVVARHPSGGGTSLLEGIFPLNEPIRARLFLLAPRPKSRRHHINKGWAWFEATGHTAARFGFLYAKRCSFHGYCSKILKLQREARRTEKRPEGRLLALLALQPQKKSAGCSACNVRRNVRSRSSSLVFSFLFFLFFFCFWKRELSRQMRTFSSSAAFF